MSLPCLWMWVFAAWLFMVIVLLRICIEIATVIW